MATARKTTTRTRSRSTSEPTDITTAKTAKAAKDRLPKRTKARNIEMVTFPVDGWDNEFTIPSMKTLSVGVQRKLTSGDLNPLVEALGEYAEVVDDMDADEIGVFMEAWGDASGIDLGKSQPASN